MSSSNSRRIVRERDHNPIAQSVSGAVMRSVCGGDRQVRALSTVGLTAMAGQLAPVVAVSPLHGSASSVYFAGQDVDQRACSSHRWN